jgi:hypothetical protein
MKDHELPANDCAFCKHVLLLKERIILTCSSVSQEKARKQQYRCQYFDITPDMKVKK